MSEYVQNPINSVIPRRSDTTTSKVSFFKRKLPCLMQKKTRVPNARLCSVPQKEHTFPSIYRNSGTEVVRYTFCAPTA